MVLDHLIIFSSNHGYEAQELLNFGLHEGSNRVHPGQGTRNRKFFFENFFLEIAWAYNKEEIISELTAPTRLWERANHHLNGSSPFGICLVNTEDTNVLFEKCLRYRPGYLADGFFEIITNENHAYLPWTCRLPGMGPSNISEEPKTHGIDIKSVTSIQFGIPVKGYKSAFTDWIESQSNILFENAESYRVTLGFDGVRMGKTKKFDSIPLTIEY